MDHRYPVGMIRLEFIKKIRAIERSSKFKSYKRLDELRQEIEKEWILT
ncbi:MAG TPA: hypothetical protein VJH22_06725 [Candidatus Nanoarchaeia archaeon]|nr:hypothetical protein [Candidatus Nanoarchaeia archaeon]